MPYINFKNEILPFDTIEMDLESVMLCEKRQTNTVCFHLYVKFKKIKQMNKQNRNRFTNMTEGRRVGKG